MPVRRAITALCLTVLALASLHAQSSVTELNEAGWKALRSGSGDRAEALFAEALTLATKLGVDPQQLVSLIEATMVRSGVVEYKAPFVLQRDFTPNFPLKLMTKDIGYAMQAAARCGLTLQTAAPALEVFKHAVNQGLGDQDFSAVVKALGKR